MKAFCRVHWLRPLLALALAPNLHTLAEPAGPGRDAVPLIKPAVPSGTGLLLEPPLDLSKFTRDEFVSISSTIGRERINKKWTTPVTPLPPPPRNGVQGLTETEIKAYMRQVRELFDQGASVPVSDVGLISTQEDVIRRPMFNHIAAFSNSVARVYLLVQRTADSKGWGYFSIVQDLTVTPPTDYFAEVRQSDVKFEGTSCYKCHSSGPLAIHPVREDLVNDPPLAAALSRHIAEQPRSQFHFPAGDRPPDYGPPLTLKFCARCHAADGDRGPLHRVHSHPMRVLIDFGYMPPNRPLNTNEIAEFKAWLEQKP